MTGHDKILASFNPTLAGEYCINVTVNGQRIGDIDHRRNYKPGDLCARDR